MRLKIRDKLVAVQNRADAAERKYNTRATHTMSRTAGMMRPGLAA